MHDLLEGVNLPLDDLAIVHVIVNKGVAEETRVLTQEFPHAGDQGLGHLGKVSDAVFKVRLSLCFGVL